MRSMQLLRDDASYPQTASLRPLTRWALGTLPSMPRAARARRASLLPAWVDAARPRGRPRRVVVRRPLEGDARGAVVARLPEVRREVLSRTMNAQAGPGGERLQPPRPE